MQRLQSGWYVVLTAGLVSGTMWALLAAISHGLPEGLVSSLTGLAPEPLKDPIDKLRNGFVHGVDSREMPTGVFLVIQAIQWVIMCWAGFRLLRRPPSPGILVAILTFSVVFRIILISSVPIHENDFARYLWDGKSAVNGINPYLYAPDAASDQAQGVERSESPAREADGARLRTLIALRDESPELYERIEHGHISTFYPPLAQGLFALSSGVFGDSVLGLKCLIMVFDIGIIILIFRTLKRLGINRAGVLFYSWSPLILIAFANSAHYDAMPVFFTLLAVSFAMRERIWRPPIALAAAACSKYFSLILTPILYRPSVRHVVVYVFVIALVISGFLPFVIWQDAGIDGVFRGLVTYTQDTESLGGVFLVIDRLSAMFLSTSEVNYVPGKMICAMILVVFAVWHSLSATPNHPALFYKCFLIMGLFFVLIPTAYPWYYSWVVPFLCAFPRPSWIFLMLSLQLYYTKFQDYALLRSEVLGLPLVNIVVWAPFFVLWFLDPVLARAFRKKVG